MLIRFLKGLIPVAAVAAVCLAGAIVRSAPDEPKTAASEPEAAPANVQAAESEQSYLGSGGCNTCHRKQTDTWSETKHAQAFDHLPAKYRNDSSCLKCHLTAFGEPGGYVPGMPADEAQPFLSVGCEACHGPGGIHEAGVKRWTLADPADEERLLEEMKAAIVKTPPDSRCAACHKPQGHQTHPPYDGQPLPSADAGHPNISPRVHGPSWETTSSVISPRPSPNSYSVKTCGSCHYEQYKQWRIGKHVGLSAKIPAEYGNDKNCLECHRKSQDTAQWYTAATGPNPKDNNPNDNQVGVGCESCHGFGLKHVMFNRQYLSGPRLGPELEQAARQSIRKEKPAAACVQCHIHLGHKEHAQFEKPDAAESK